MGMADMLVAAQAPMGAVGGMFKNPAAEGTDALASAHAGLSVLGGLVGPGTAASLKVLDDTNASVTATLSAKVANLSTQLPVAVAAAKVADTTTKVDAALSGDFSKVDVIGSTFQPSKQCSIPSVSAGFAVLTDSKKMLTDAADAVHSAFDNTGAMGPLYSALNAIPGVVVSSGKDLLAFLGTMSGAVAATVTSALTALKSSNPGLMTGLQSGFDSVHSSVTQMGASFGALAASSEAACAEHLKAFTGASMLNLTQNTDPCVQAVMATVVNKEAIDLKAVSMKSAIEASSKQSARPPSSPAAAPVYLPGQQSAAAASTGKPLSEDHGMNTSTTKTIAEPYTGAELSAFHDLVLAKKDENNAAVAEAARWLKTNLEDWKPTVNYAQKMLAAGASREVPEGTTTNETVRAVWIEVRDQQRVIVKQYNTEVLLTPKALLAQWGAMVTEFNARLHWGKRPYSTMIAAGIAVPEDQQFTYLDSTK